MKKFTSVILALLVILSCATVFTFGTSAAWDGSVSVDFAGGNGTEKEPFEIASAQDLALLAKKVNEEGNSFEGVYFKMTADIDLGGTPWTSIGTAVESVNVFMGHFDGSGYTVSGLTMEETTNNTGLFGRISGAVVENLTVKGSKVVGAKYTGGIVGYAIKGSTVYNCHTEIDHIEGITIGGIVGRSQDAAADGSVNVIKGCTSKSNLRLLPGTNNVFAGGMVGAAGATEISWCGNYGNINGPEGATTLMCAGGIVGIQGANGATTNVRNCFNLGDISILSTADATYAGGIVGRAAHVTAETYIENCFSTGKTSVVDSTGVDLDEKHGSLIGHIRYVAFVSNCYTSVPISECAEVGFDPNVCIETGNITVLSEAQMKGKDAVTNMKLGAGWVADAAGYPTIDVSAIKDEQTTVEQTTPAPVDTTTAAPVDTTTPAPADTTTPAPADTTTQASAPADTTTTAPQSESDGGPNIFVILIIVVVVLAVGAVVVVVVMDKKKK